MLMLAKYSRRIRCIFKRCLKEGSSFNSTTKKWLIKRIWDMEHIWDGNNKITCNFFDCKNFTETGINSISQDRRIQFWLFHFQNNGRHHAIENLLL